MPPEVNSEEEVLQERKSPETRSRPLIASIRSALFMGFGQAYNGEIVKAAVFMMLYAGSIAMTYFIIGLITTPILWLWGIVDAYRSAKKIIQKAPAK